MSLIQPIELLAPHQLGPVHFIAAGGAGMNGIASLYAQLGVPVTGSDQASSAALTALAESGVRTFVGHDPAQLGDAETVVVSSAVRPTNVELAEARRRGLRVWHRSAALGALMLGHRGVAVSGTHGKTTTTAMIATALVAADADPSYVVGSPLTATGRSQRLGSGEAFVVEADESDGSFLQYPAEIVVITNVESDHLDNWGDPQAYADGFVRLACAPAVRAVVISADDPGAVAITDAIRSAGKQVVTFGEAAGADIRLTDIVLAGRESSAVLTDGDQRGAVRLAVPGRYNLLNFAAAYAVGRLLDCDAASLRSSASTFAGTYRRFQPVAETADIRIFDDYAHHPTEVLATLTAARTMVGPGRLIACFQPHLFTRTRDFADDFGRSLAVADHVVVCGIYPAREDPLPGVTGRLVADAVAAVVGPARVAYSETLTDAVAALSALVRSGDVVVTIGAGDVTTVGPLLAESLASKA